MASEKNHPVFVAGRNRSKKLIISGEAVMVYLASDADLSLIESMYALCLTHGVAVDQSKTKQELAELCGIEVGCAVCTVIQ